MWRPAKVCLPIVCAATLSGCTGFGVFLDHTDQWFSRNPNMPAGSSETFMVIRGEKVDVPPLLPETGNIWPSGDQKQLTLEDLAKQQDQELKTLGQGTGTPPVGPNPQVNRANQADQGLPPPRPAPRPGRMPSVTPTPNGPAMDTTTGGSAKGYRDLQGGPAGKGILIPNGNGTSTLIGPDGSVQTVPTKP